MTDRNLLAQLVDAFEDYQQHLDSVLNHKINEYFYAQQECEVLELLDAYQANKIDKESFKIRKEQLQSDYNNIIYCISYSGRMQELGPDIDWRSINSTTRYSPKERLRRMCVMKMSLYTPDHMYDHATKKLLPFTAEENKHHVDVEVNAVMNAIQAKDQLFTNKSLFVKSLLVILQETKLTERQRLDQFANKFIQGGKILAERRRGHAVFANFWELINSILLKFGFQKSQLGIDGAKLMHQVSILFQAAGRPIQVKESPPQAPAISP